MPVFKSTPQGAVKCHKSIRGLSVALFFHTACLVSFRCHVYVWLAEKIPFNHIAMQCRTIITSQYKGARQNPFR
jgi:hypothetical protein